MLKYTLSVSLTSERSRSDFRSISRAVVIGSHWYVVPGLGTSGFTDATMRPRVAPARTSAIMRSRISCVRSRIATRSSSVSVGSPIM
jgi:hypothetical protein